MRSDPIARFRSPHRKLLLLGVAVAAVIGPLVLLQQLAVQAGPVAFYPDADAYVQASTPNANKGGSTKLRADGDPLTVAYLRFNVSGMNAPIQKAVLRVYATANHSTGFGVHAVADNTWSEKGITFDNAPPYSPADLGLSGPIVSGTWVTIDVSKAVQGNGPVSFALVTGSRTAVAMVSREGNHAPELVVESPADATAAATPVAPTPTGAPNSTATTATPTLTPTPTPTPGTPPPSLAFPIRAAFYYPWFPEAWSQRGIYPFTNYQPSLGYYDLAQSSTIRQHITAMQYGKISVGISSWWGQGHRTDVRLPLLLTSAAGTGFSWTIYHEGEGQGDPSVAELTSDLTYIRDHYAADPSFLKIDGRFVVFVYADAADACGMADRWNQANTVNAYLVLKVFSGYRNCATQPDGWHQYAPAVAYDQQGTYSTSISPGFWLKGETVRLARDLPTWNQSIRNMVASGARFQLVTTFNEWGEGTSTESASEWASVSGYGAYLDALHYDGAAPSSTPVPVRTATSTATPTPIPTATAAPGGSVVLAFGGDVGGSDTRAGVVLPAAVAGGAAAFWAVGDLSYSEKTPESAWCDWIKEKVGAAYPIELIVGNHEEEGGPDGYILNFTQCLPDRLGSTMGPGGYGVNYYADVGPARVISIAADLKVSGVRYGYAAGAPERVWLESAVTDARARGLWVIVATHKPCLTMGVKSCEIGESLADYLASNVDLVVSGHDHNYQRSHQIRCADVGQVNVACIADSDGNHRHGDGAVWVIVGLVGRSLNTCTHADTEAGYFADHWCAEEATNTHGYLRVTASGTEFRGEFRTQAGTAHSDAFVIWR